MNKEIERKFLVQVSRIPFKMEEMEYGDIIQGYISSIDKTFTFRIRQTLHMTPDKVKIDEHYTQTIKSKGDKVRDEYEIELDREQFSVIWRLCNNDSVHKKRYKLPVGSHTIELDVYKNELDGLYTVEVEFETEEESDNYLVPEWFGPEVTYEDSFKNVNLALNKKIPMTLIDLSK